MQIAASAAGVLIALVLHFGLARLLPPDQFALYGLALAAQHLVIIGQDCGFRTLVIRETAKPSTGFFVTPEALLRQAVGHAILATMLALAAALVFLGNKPLGLLISLALLGGLAKTVASLISAVLFAKRAALTEARWQMIARLTAAIATLGIAYAVKPTAAMVLLALLMAQAIMLAPRLHGVTLEVPQLPRSQAIYRAAAPLAMLSVLTALYFRTGSFFLYHLHDDLSALAHFTLGHRLIDAAIMVMSPAMQMLFVHTRTLNDENRKTTIQQHWVLAYLATVAFCITVALVLGERTIVALAGAPYAGVGKLLPWLILALAAAVPNFVLMQVHLAENREGLVLRSAGLAVLIGIAANALLVPVLGAIGAAIALALSEAAQLASLLTGLIWSRRHAANT